MITPNEPDVTLTGKYCTTAAAKALGIHRNSISNYESANLIHSCRSRQTGRKYYTGAEIIRFWKARTR